jgi:hypothetical protein
VGVTSTRDRGVVAEAEEIRTAGLLGAPVGPGVPQVFNSLRYLNGFSSFGSVSSAMRERRQKCRRLRLGHARPPMDSRELRITLHG